MAAGLLLLAAGCAAQEKPAAPAPLLHLPPFELADQEGKIHAYPGADSRPTVILVAGEDGAESNTGWDHWLTARYGSRIEIFRVVDLSSVLKLFSPIVTARIREGANPPGIPILLDWEGFFENLLPLVKESTTLLLADPESAILFVLRGPPQEAQKAETAWAIDALLEQTDGG